MIAGRDEASRRGRGTADDSLADGRLVVVLADLWPRDLRR